MKLPRDVRPLRLGQDGPGTLTVSWSNGHQGRHGVRQLRLACRCAQCVDEWTGAARLNESSVPADVHPVTIEPVGLYGLQIDWSDGHNTGILTFEVLASACECSECASSGDAP